MASPEKSDWLRSTIGAVREVVLRRLEAKSLDPDAQREVEMALEELDVMWEELQGQRALLTQERERYGDFFENAPDAYVVTDVGGNIREANKAAREQLGIARGKSLDGYIDDEDRCEFLSRLVSLAPGEPDTWQSHLQNRKVTLSVRAMPLKKSGVGGLCWLIRPG